MKTIEPGMLVAGALGAMLLGAILGGMCGTLFSRGEKVS
jgi:hypothetical protein